MTYILVVLGLSVLGVLGDASIKLAGQRSPASLALLGVAAVLYVLSVPGWLFVMRNIPLTAVGALYAASTVLVLTAVGVVGFHERLNVSEVFGVAFALLAVVALRRVL